MDRIISEYPYHKDNDLNITPYGVAYQNDMTQLVSYDSEYFNKCLGYEGKDIALGINVGRIDFVKKYHIGMVLDVGIGSGEFIKSRGRCHGYDINPEAVKWLKENNLYSEDFEAYKAFTFWDVIEHIPNPSIYFDRIPEDSYLFVSLPIFESLDKIRESKHYRPNEHLYYWTDMGFTGWMWKHGFTLMESSNFETVAGRENIHSFAFFK